MVRDAMVLFMYVVTMFLDEERIHELVIAKTWLPLIINT